MPAREPAVLLLRVYPGAPPTPEKTRAVVFTESLFIMANNWKQLGGPQQENGYIYSGLFYYCLFKKMFFHRIHGIWKLPGQGSYPRPRCDLHHSCCNTGSLTNSAGPGVEQHLSTNLSYCSQFPNPLHHIGNSGKQDIRNFFFFLVPLLENIYIFLI